MCDPLSIATAAVSLLGASFKLTKSVNTICITYQQAPQSVSALRTELNVTHASLVQLNQIFRPPTKVLDGVDHEARQHVLHGFDLATLGIAHTLVSLDSSIHKLADGIDSNGRMSLVARARFMWGESDLKVMMNELRDQRDALGHLIACLQLSKTIDIEGRLNSNSPCLNALRRTASQANVFCRSEVLGAHHPGSVSDELGGILKRRNTVLDTEEDSTSRFTWRIKSPPSRANSEPAVGGKTQSFSDQSNQGSNPAAAEAGLEANSRPLSTGSNQKAARSDQGPSQNTSLFYSNPSSNGRVHHALHLAVTDNALQNVRSLISTGSDPLALPINPYGSLHNSNKNPFCLAAYLGRVDILEFFIQQGYSSAVNDVTTNDIPPLLAASYGGKERAVRLLLHHGANSRLQGSKNNTSLFWACARGHANVATILVENGATLDINLSNTQGLTPLIVAAQHGHAEVVQYLLSVGADAGACNKKQQTALHLAAHGGHLEVVEALLAAKAPVQPMTTNGKTPLIFAAAGGHALVLDALVCAGASPDLHDADHRTALYHACRHGHTAAASTLLSHSASLIAPVAGTGDTVLHVAVEKGHASTVGALLEAAAGAREFGTVLSATRSEDGLDALGIACACGHVDIIAPLLLDRAAREPTTTQDAFYTAARWGLAETMDVLVDAGADVNFRDEASGQSLLARAVREGHEEAVAALIARGAKVAGEDKFGATPLHRAARLGNVGIAARLIENGADLEKGDKGGHRPLHVACMYAPVDMVRFLADRNADLESLSEAKKTPLMLAGEQRREDVVRALVECGACVGSGKGESTVIFTANENGLVEVNMTGLLHRLTLQG